MTKCKICGADISASEMRFILKDESICVHCAATLTLEEISMYDSALDCAVYPELIQGEFTVNE